ncbi:MAG: thiolase domain-containing protein [Bacillota bacterium]
MRDAAIVGFGQTPFGDFPALSIKELFAQAFSEMVASVDKGFDPALVQALYVGTLGVGGFQLGQPAALLAGYVGLPSIPAVRVENACASGGFALLQAVCAVRSGLYDVVVAAGMEKMRDLSGVQGRYWLGVSGDTEYERLAGLTFAGIYALMARRYMAEYGMEHRHLSLVAVKNHRHGALNPKAQIRRQITVEEAESAPMVADPLRLYDCCPTSDGAACALVVAGDRVAEFTDRPAWVAGFGAASDWLAVHDRRSLTQLDASIRAAQQAYAMAGLGPQDIHVAEVHDCFTIAEILAYEDLGLAARGKGYRLLEEGATSLGGRLPVNTSGGLKAKGHPLGATGIGQVGEIFNQLRGTAGQRQVPGAEVGLTHNVGGSGGTAVVFVFRGGAS